MFVVKFKSNRLKILKEIEGKKDLPDCCVRLYRSKFSKNIFE